MLKRKEPIVCQRIILAPRHTLGLILFIYFSSFNSSIPFSRLFPTLLAHSSPFIRLFYRRRRLEKINANKTSKGARRVREKGIKKRKSSCASLPHNPIPFINRKSTKKKHSTKWGMMMIRRDFMGMKGIKWD